MRIGGAIILIVIGAILEFAITIKNDHGFNVHTIGLILIVVGAVWLVAEIAYSFTRRRTDVVHRDPAGTAQSTTYVDPPPDYR